MPGNDVVSDAQQTITDGLGVVSDQLQTALAAPVVVPSTVMALDGLRSRYVLDQMQLTRGSINQLDTSAAMKSALAGIAQAIASLKATQSSANATTDWINDAANKLDEVMDAVGVAKSITGGGAATSPTKGK